MTVCDASVTILPSAKIIWSMPDGVNQNWNVFAPGFIHDVSGDGVRDMIVINGGDTQYSPQVLYRYMVQVYESFTH